jgi:hypothetical protein
MVDIEQEHCGNPGCSICDPALLDPAPINEAQQRMLEWMGLARRAVQRQGADAMRGFEAGYVIMDEAAGFTSGREEERPADRP